MSNRSEKERQKHRSTISRSSGTDDYILAAIAYAEDAIADRTGQTYGKWIRLAAKRFIKDLKATQSKRPPFLWSASKAIRHCKFIERLPHVEGNWSSRNIVLEPCQCFAVVQLFGFRKLDGRRRFSMFLYAVARKNTKSTLLAAILLSVYCLEAENGPQILSAATTGDQAGVVFNIARRMALRNSGLQEAFDIEVFVKAIVRYDVGGIFKAINAKASTQDGLNPSALSFDELHAHKNSDLFNVLRSAAGARSDPLFCYATTEGYETPGPWPEVRNFAKQILEGVLEVDHMLALYYALDDGDDDFDESKWVKANPMLGVSITLEKIREKAIEARAQPSQMAEFKIKTLNRQAAAASGWIDLRKWGKCDGAVNLKELEGQPCWGGLDLASTTDMNAWALLWLVDEIYYVFLRYWVPSAAVAQRTERRSVPYAGWVQAKLLTQTEGDVADYAVIRRSIIEDCERFSPQKVGFDPWNATQLALELADAGVQVEKFIQGPRSYTPAMNACERAYVSGRLRHGGNKILTWNAANLVPRYDENKNIAPNKKRSADKIDGMIAVLEAFGMSVPAEGDGDAEGFFANPVMA